MPRIPDFTALGNPPAPQAGGGVAGYSPVDMGGAARGLAAGGADLQEGASQLAHAQQLVNATNRRQDQMIAQAAANQLQAKALELEAGDGGFRGVRGGGAVGQQFLDSYQQKFDDAKGLIEGTLQNDEQHRAFQVHAPIVGLKYRAALLSHQAQETDRFNDKTENDTIDLGRRQVITNITDPIAVTAGMQQVDWAIDQKAKRLGWSPETIAQTKVKYRDLVFQDAAATLVERDPHGALAALNRKVGVGTEPADTGIAAIDNLPADKAIELRHRALSYVTQEQNQLRAEQQKRLTEADRVTKELTDFVTAGNMVSPAYQQQVLLSVMGTPFEEPAKQLISGSFAGAMHGSATIPQQEARLRQIDAQQQGGTDPESAKLVQRMRTITETQKKAYADNPWAAATQFARQPQVPEVQIADASQAPQLVAQRVPLMATIETYAGQPVSPLQPNEAAQLADKLQALPPQARATVLGQIGQQLNAPRIAALAEQINKKDRPLALALMMGTDQTTAGRTASTYVLRGAQALADKTVKKDESALAGWRADIAAKVRGTLGDDKAESDLIDAAYYVRAALDQEGIAPAPFKPMSASADNALSLVIGNPIERAGVRTFTPRGMSESQFNAKLATYTAGKLKEQAPEGVLYVRGNPVKVEQIAAHLSEYGLRRDGAGRYVPSVNNAPITTDKAGSNVLRLEVR